MRPAAERQESVKSPSTTKRQSLGVDAAILTLVGCALGLVLGAARGFPGGPTEEGVVCEGPTSAQPTVTWIPIAQAERLHRESSALFLDARDATIFQRGHITGALNAPVATQTPSPGQLAQWLQAPTIVAYCDTQGECAHSTQLAELMAEAGHPDVRVLEGGYPKWLAKSLPAEAGQ